MKKAVIVITIVILFVAALAVSVPFGKFFGGDETPAAKRTDKLEASLRQQARVINSALPITIGDDAVIKSVEAEGKLLRFIVETAGPLSKSGRKNLARAIETTAPDAICGIDGLQALFKAGAAYIVALYDDSEMLLAEVDIEAADCKALEHG